jgi:hypothetical protein
MCRGQVVGVEPDVFFPAMFDEFFVCNTG